MMRYSFILDDPAEDESINKAHPYTATPAVHPLMSSGIITFRQKSGGDKSIHCFLFDQAWKEIKLEGTFEDTTKEFLDSLGFDDRHLRAILTLKDQIREPVSEIVRIYKEELFDTESIKGLWALVFEQNLSEDLNFGVALAKLSVLPKRFRGRLMIFKKIVQKKIEDSKKEKKEDAETVTKSTLPKAVLPKAVLRDTLREVGLEKYLEDQEDKIAWDTLMERLRRPKGVPELIFLLDEENTCRWEGTALIILKNITHFQLFRRDHTFRKTYTAEELAEIDWSKWQKDLQSWEKIVQQLLPLYQDAKSKDGSMTLLPRHIPLLAKIIKIPANELEYTSNLKFLDLIEFLTAQKYSSEISNVEEISLERTLTSALDNTQQGSEKVKLSKSQKKKAKGEERLLTHKVTAAWTRGKDGCELLFQWLEKFSLLNILVGAPNLVPGKTALVSQKEAFFTQASKNNTPLYTYASMIYHAVVLLQALSRVAKIYEEPSKSALFVIARAYLKLMYEAKMEGQCCACMDSDIGKVLQEQFYTHEIEEICPLVENLLVASKEFDPKIDL